MCSFWAVVFENWGKKRPCSFEEFVVLRNRYETNRNFLRAFFNYFFPSRKYKLLAECLELLFDEIFNVSGKPIIIDSSKTAARALVLSRFTKVSLIHVVRNFRGVLNSEQKDVKVNLEKGIESASPPKSFSKVFIDWFITNTACFLARVSLFGKKLAFRSWIRNPKILHRYHSSLKSNFEKEFFKAPHMIAGNAIRMKPPQALRLDGKADYNRLNPFNYKMAHFIELIFPFWS